MGRGGWPDLGVGVLDWPQACNSRLLKGAPLTLLVVGPCLLFGAFRFWCGDQGLAGILVAPPVHRLSTTSLGSGRGYVEVSAPLLYVGALSLAWVAFPMRSVLREEILRVRHLTTGAQVGVCYGGQAWTRRTLL